MEDRKLDLKALFTAISGAQKEFASIKKDRTGYGYKYADINDVLEAIRPVLAKYGLSIMQFPEGTSDNQYLTTTIAHISGQFLQFRTPMIIEKKNAQGFGSALTYIRRYSLVSALGLECEDDDGAEASKPAQNKPAPKPNKRFISEAQKKRLYSMSHPLPKEQVKLILAQYGYESSNDIEVKDYEVICEKIKQKAEAFQVTQPKSSGV